MAAAAKKEKFLRVTAPLVQVGVGDRSVQYFYGDVLPDGVSEDSVKHLKSLGYVEEADGPASDASDATEPDAK